MQENRTHKFLEEFLAIPTVPLYEDKVPALENIYNRDWIQMTKLLFEVAINREKMLGKREYLLARFMERFQKFRKRCLIES